VERLKSLSRKALRSQIFVTVALVLSAWLSLSFEEHFRSNFLNLPQGQKQLEAWNRVTLIPVGLPLFGGIVGSFLVVRSTIVALTSAIFLFALRHAYPGMSSEDVQDCATRPASEVPSPMEVSVAHLSARSVTPTHPAILCEAAPALPVQLRATLLPPLLTEAISTALQSVEPPAAEASALAAQHEIEERRLKVLREYFAPGNGSIRVSKLRHFLGSHPLFQNISDKDLHEATTSAFPLVKPLAPLSPPWPAGYKNLRVKVMQDTWKVRKLRSLWVSSLCQWFHVRTLIACLGYCFLRSDRRTQEAIDATKQATLRQRSTNEVSLFARVS
jgi:hypothetical protein